MAIRLVKISKELNVGTSTIVDFLAEKGFTIDNKPTAKVSDEMHDILLKEYKGDMAVKEKADKLIIGNRIAEKEKTPTPAPIVKEEPNVVEPVIVEPVEPTAPVKVVEKPVEVKETPPRSNAPGLKVVGKIDLTPKPKVKKVEPKVKKEEPKKEIKPPKLVPPPKEPKVVAKKVDKGDKAPSAPKSEEVVRAKTPTLQGLKIMGKIDTNKFERPKKKSVASKPGEGNKRKRTRTKVKATNFIGQRAGGKGGNKGGKGDKGVGGKAPNASTSRDPTR